jgi:hypothetical protein
MNQKVTVADGTWTKTLDKSTRPETGDYTWFYDKFYRVIVKNLYNNDNYIVLRAKNGETISIDSSVYQALGRVDINS